jgi:hypothetical protein
MGNFDTILSRIDQLTNTANQELSGGDPRTYIGRATAKAQAQDLLPEAIAEYMQSLRKVTSAIIVLGDKTSANEFARIAAAEGQTINVNGAALYEQIAAELAPTMDAAGLGLTQSTLLDQIVDEIGQSLEVDPPNVEFKKSYFAKTQDEIANAVRETLRSQLGDVFNLLFIEKNAMQQAANRRYNQSVLPVVITGLTKDEADNMAKLFDGNTTVINVSGTVTTDEVLSAFGLVKQKAVDAKKKTKKS